MDEKGKVIGHGYVDRPGRLLAGYLDSLVLVQEDDIRKPPPKNPCRHGHTTGWKLKSDGHYKCSICERAKTALRKSLSAVAAVAGP